MEEDIANSSAVLIKGGHLVQASEINQLDVLIEDGVIQKIGKDISADHCDEILDADGKYVMAGFIDIHNHGADGFDFSFGKYSVLEDQFVHNSEYFKLGLRKALDFYLAKGITRVYPTTMAAPLETLLQSFAYLQSFLEEFPAYLPLVGGINLEGTFLKDPAYAGAQNPKFFYDLNSEIIDQLLRGSKNGLTIINIPPEHGSIALDLIAHLSSLGIVIAAGHTAAYGDQLADAVEAGLRLGVHFRNGPARSSSKSFHQGGAEEMMLKSDAVYLEIIADGYHVDPSYVRDIIARKGVDRVIVITDSMFANGMQRLGEFSLFGLHGSVSENGQYLQMLNAEDCLFGSVLSSNVAFANIVNWLTREIAGVWHRSHQPLSVNDALVSSSKMCSANPAQLLNIYDPIDTPGTGSIEIGKWGDLIVGEMDFKNGEFRVKDTLVHGIKIPLL